MRKFFVFFVLLTLCAGICNGAIKVIPKPLSVIEYEGRYELPAARAITVYAPDFKGVGIVLAKLPAAINSVLTTNAKKADFFFIVDTTLGIESEGYTLKADKKGVRITAATEQGLFYGAQTLLQLIENSGHKYIVPAVEIKDTPRFGWRGVMLDVARNFFTKEEVMELIDQISQYKMNRFHWHLTDDQGWRIEIKALPELVEKSSKRIARLGDWYHRSEPDPTTETAVATGYYTQDDIKEVVAYAAERFVTVVPEVDVPGHATSILFAINDLACLEAPKMINSGSRYWGVHESSLCVGAPRTMSIMDTIFSEVASLFPSEYIHIGGDECYKGFWEKCPKCNALMKEKGIENVQQLQSYFIKNMETMLNAKGKKIIGWDEILEGGLAPQATVMSWRGMDGGIAAAKEGHHVIMTPSQHCYLDLYQGEPTAEPTTYSMSRLGDAYAFEPVPEGVAAELILGGQGNLWAESVPTFRHAQYMLYPRAWALAEVLWSDPKGRDINEFVPRVEAHFSRADAADINYARSMYNPIVDAYMEGEAVKIELKTEFDGLDIFYTFDGTNPDTYSPQYSEPLSIPKDAARIRMRTYRSGEPVGALISIEMPMIVERASANKTHKSGNLD